MLSLRLLLLVILAGGAVAWRVPQRAAAGGDMTEKARQFVEDFTKQIRPLDIAANRAWWDANITGRDEDFKRKEEAQNQIDRVLSNTDAFAEVKKIKDAADIDDPVTKRAVDVIYLLYIEK